MSEPLYRELNGSATIGDISARQAVGLWGAGVCECGALVIDREAHSQFHAVLNEHAAALARGRVHELRTSPTSALAAAPDGDNR